MSNLSTQQSEAYAILLGDDRVTPAETALALVAC
jgi:hypothetical protein